MTFLLRPWRASDAPDLLLACTTTPDLATQLPTAETTTVEAARAVIADHLTPGDTYRPWALEVDGAVVGTVALSALETRHGTGWASYWLASAGRGRGHASAALAAAAAWAFERDFFRLELGHRVNNPASCGVATRAGFVAEGVERAKLRYGDERYDVETHARLATDPYPDLSLPRIVG